MKLADPTLLKDKCLVDGKWVGEGVDPIDNPATGELIAKVPRFGHAEAVRRDRGGGARLRPLGEGAAQRAGADSAPLVRPHHRQSRRHRASS